MSLVVRRFFSKSKASLLPAIVSTSDSPSLKISFRAFNFASWRLCERFIRTPRRKGAKKNTQRETGIIGDRRRTSVSLKRNSSVCL